MDAFLGGIQVSIVGDDLQLDKRPYAVDVVEGQFDHGDPAKPVSPEGEFFHLGNRPKAEFDQDLGKFIGNLGPGGSGNSNFAPGFRRLVDFRTFIRDEVFFTDLPQAESLVRFRKIASRMVEIPVDLLNRLSERRTQLPSTLL